MKDQIVINFANYVLGAKVTVFKEDGRVQESKIIPHVDGDVIGALAKEEGINDIVLRGPKDFTQKKKELALTNYGNLNITCVE